MKIFNLKIYTRIIGNLNFYNINDKKVQIKLINKKDI